MNDAIKTSVSTRQRTADIHGELARILDVPWVRLAPVGSRVTCDPAPVGTDEDWLLLITGTITATQTALAEAGFSQDGSPGFYTGNDAGGFQSWRRGDVNIVTTQDPRFFELFMTATHLAKRFNLLDKGDRIALFQAVLYGVRVENLSGTGEL